MVPGMVYATVLESPLEGARPDFVNTADALAVPGITHVLPMPFGVAVVGNTVEATRMARFILKPKVTWNTSGAAAAAAFDSERDKAAYERAGQDPAAKPKDAYKQGDVAAAFGSAARVVEGTYWTQHAYHAQLEPMNCTARVAEDGQSAEIWVGTQNMASAAAAAAGVLKVTPDKIRINQQLMGGGYGRRLIPDIVAQAVALSNATKKTVKLILTREDDMAAGRPRPMTHHVMRAAFDGSGKLTGWRHRIVSENVDAVAAPGRFAATGGDYIGWNGSDMPHYAIPNWLSEGVREIHGMRVQSFRGIGSGYNKFAVESFIDEVAHARKMDPLALRLELTQNDPRATAVLKAAADMADWKRKRPGRGLGIAFTDYHGTLSAGIAEVSVNRATGKIKVHNYWVAVDAGVPVQPTNVLAQLEGGAAWGMSVALIERADVKDGAIVQSNYNDYPVLRMSDMPEIHTRIVPSQAAPSGMGEIGVSAVAPAIGNAVFNLTGKRVREVPMRPATVKKALA
jgi:isoquinoline 1-oxidoreductase beta subunit